MTRDLQPPGMIQAMGGESVHPRIEVELRATPSARLFDQPVHQAPAEPAPATSCGGDEVIDIKDASPGEEFAHPKASEGRGLPILLEHHQFISAVLLLTPHAFHDLVRPEMGT